MAAAKTERLINLTMALLATPRFLTKAEIFSKVEGYQGTPEATDRMFERDKDDLRELGIPLMIGRSDPLADVDDGYRIDPKAYSLPAITFTAQEASVIALAAQLWREATFANSARSALLKLRATGEELSSDDLLDARLSSMEPAFATVWEAVKERRQIAFDYRRRDGEVSSRQIEPWGVLSWHGAWYLVGFDLSRQASRVFRLSRITSDVAYLSKPGSYQVPAGLDLRAQVADSSPEDKRIAVLLIAKGAAPALRRRAISCVAEDALWDRIEITVGDVDALAKEMLWLADRVIVKEPKELRALVVASLRAVAK